MQNRVSRNIRRSKERKSGGTRRSGPVVGRMKDVRRGTGEEVSMNRMAPESGVTHGAKLR